MAYINFAEEKYKTDIQLKKRRKNNKNVIGSIVKDKNSLSLKPDMKWSFNSFENMTFNNEITQSHTKFVPIENKDIVCSIFKDCKFYNMKFVNCNFIGCRFLDCDFGGGGVSFENCNFLLECTNKAPDLNEKENLSCEFVRCSIYAQFKCSAINYSIFDQCRIKNTDFSLTDMTSAIIIYSELDKINIADSDMSGTKILNTYIQDFEFNDKVKTKVDEKTFVDKIIPRKKTKDEYEGIYMVYETLANKFNENNLLNNFGEYYYLAKTTQFKSLDKFSAKLSSFSYWALCGYGERVVHTLITSLILILIFAILFLLFGMEIDGIELAYAFGIGLPSSFTQLVLDFNEALYMSISTFASVGASGGTDAVPLTYIISDIETIIGIIVIGVGIGSIVRKLVR